jgi:hypothetical protein
MKKIIFLTLTMIAQVAMSGAIENKEAFLREKCFERYNSASLGKMSAEYKNLTKVCMRLRGGASLEWAAAAYCPLGTSTEISCAILRNDLDDANLVLRTSSKQDIDLARNDIEKILEVDYALLGQGVHRSAKSIHSDNVERKNNILRRLENLRTFDLISASEGRFDSGLFYMGLNILKSKLALGEREVSQLSDLKSQGLDLELLRIWIQSEVSILESKAELASVEVTRFGQNSKQAEYEAQKVNWNKKLEFLNSI